MRTCPDCGIRKHPSAYVRWHRRCRYCESELGVAFRTGHRHKGSHRGSEHWRVKRALAAERKQGSRVLTQAVESESVAAPTPAGQRGKPRVQEMAQTLRKVLDRCDRVQYDDLATPNSVRLASQIFGLALEADRDKDYYGALADPVAGGDPRG